MHEEINTSRDVYIHASSYTHDPTPNARASITLALGYKIYALQAIMQNLQSIAIESFETLYRDHIL